MRTGFVKLPNAIEDWVGFEGLSGNAFGLLLRLFQKVTWKESDIYLGHVLKRGQMLTSYNKLGDLINASRSTAIKVIKELEAIGLISVQSEKCSHTIVTLNAYNLCNEKDTSIETCINSTQVRDITKTASIPTSTDACIETCINFIQVDDAHHINIDSRYKDNIIPPMTSQDFPPYSEEEEEASFASPLEPMAEIPFDEPAAPQEQETPLQQEQAAKSQAAQATQAQGTLPGLQPIEKNASGKQRKQPKEKLLPQWQQDFECWWKEFLSLSKGIEGKGGKAIGKTEARKAWESLRNKGELPSLQDMIEGLKKYAALNGWERNSQKYIPHASTFLNQKRWEDEVARSWGGSYGFNSNVASQATPQPSLPNAPQPVKPTYSPWEEIVFQMSELGSNRIREAGFSQETLNAVKYIGGWGVLFNISSRELSFKKSEYEKYVRGA